MNETVLRYRILAPGVRRTDWSCSEVFQPYSGPTSSVSGYTIHHATSRRYSSLGGGKRTKEKEGEGRRRKEKEGEGRRRKEKEEEGRRRKEKEGEGRTRKDKERKTSNYRVFLYN